MKKVIYLLMAMALLLALLPAGSFAHTADDPHCTNLIAGGGGEGKSAIDVGDVCVWNDEEYLYVEYSLDDEAISQGWCLTETHLDVQLSMQEIPQTKKGNPTPGHFACSQEHDCITSYTYQIPVTCDLLYIAAHAAIRRPASVIVYGSQLASSPYTGDVYAIDLSSMTAMRVHVWEGSISAPNYPNGDAYDPENERVYFATPDKQLWFLDLGDSQAYHAGALSTPSLVASGAWYNGKYYYIPQGTDDLREVTINADGSVSTDAKLCNYTGNSKSFSFGDIVFDSAGLLLGSANASPGGYEYFTIDINDSTCTYVKEASPDKHKQLAFSGGTLYGLDAQEGVFYIVDPGTWAETSIGTVTGADEGFTGKFTDLASGPTSYQTETAWGDGLGFPGKNWATYFTYEVQCPPVIAGWDTARGGGYSLNSTASSQARADLISAYGDVDFRALGALTTANLADVDVVILSSVKGDSAAITPLTGLEQDALEAFVLSGGCAILFPDNSTFAGGNSDPANESLIDPFGLDIMGTLTGGYYATISGATWTLVGSYFGNYAGWFDDTGTAAVLATLDSNGQPSLVEFAPDSITSGSGRVLVYSDANVFFGGGSGRYSSNWQLFLDTVDACFQP